jgi:uncharacterized protein (TIGR03435 family)
MNMPLLGLINLAYGTMWYQVSGGPPWLETQRHDIEAKPGSPLGSELFAAASAGDRIKVFEQSKLIE